ncbi:PREDICTED: protein S100-A4-like [Acanthisitta chloris]|uniref:protein S100-A4-like n=1 Tax=Acanthisitta chloris TaxID=57068 RepID=UPI0004F0DF4A|nr:PREDICTED: protein S100-A4-like [Acanthisitta chloris]
MACPLEQALAVIVSVFHKYSGRKQMDEAELRRLMNDLDHNKDSEVDFKEYVCFLACITMGFNEFFKDDPSKQQRRK